MVLLGTASVNRPQKTTVISQYVLLCYGSFNVYGCGQFNVRAETEF